MALNKSNTSTGVKVVLIILIIAFVMSFISIGAGLFSGNNTQNQPQQSTDPLAAVNAKYQPTVGALTSQLQSEPESYTVLVNLGNTYFDWALNVQQASQTSTSSVGADQPLWTSAKDAYSRALQVKGDEPAVSVDYSIALFYTGDTKGAIRVATDVTKSNPDFAPAYFNLGIFYGAINDNAKAKAAFEQALKLDPTGKQINADVAKSRLKELGSSAATGSATTTP